MQTGYTFQTGELVTPIKLNQLVNDAVLDADEVTTAKILNGAVTTSKISDSAVTNAKLANVATGTFKGRNSAGTGVVEDLTAATVRAMIGVRERLSAARTYYVATTGSDSNNGLTSGTPFLTIQKAINVALELDLNGYTVTIQLADGTYTAGVSITTPFLGGNVTIKGNTSNPQNVIISTTSANAVSVSNKAVVTVQDMRLQTTASHSCLFVDRGSAVYFGNIDFAGSALAHIYIINQAFVWAFGNYSITNGAAYHIYGDKSAVADIQDRTITLFGTPNFSAYFVLVQWLACARLASNTFSGGATGARYRADVNAVISVSGAGATYLPGNSAGQVNFGGQYV